MTTGHYVTGTGVRCWIQCRIEGALVDPAGLAYHVTDPTDTPDDYIYSTDVELVRDSAGAYHIDVNANLAGTWYYRWDSTDGLAEQSDFEIEASNQA